MPSETEVLVYFNVKPLKVRKNKRCCLWRQSDAYSVYTVYTILKSW